MPQADSDFSRRLLQFLREAFPFYQSLGIGFVLLGLVALFAFPTAPKGSPVYQLADWGSHRVNDTFLTVGSLALLGLAWKNRSRALLVRSVGAMLGETIAVHTIKGLDMWLLNAFPRPSGGGGGFPSGHASAACTMAYLLTCHAPRMSPVWYAIAAWIAWSRRDVRGHFEYQIVGGVIVGMLVAVYFVHRFPWPDRDARSSETINEPVA